MVKKTILFVCIAAVVVLGCLLVFNKTFLHDYYQVTNDNGKEAKFMTLPFSFYAGEPEKHTAVFYRFGNKKDMEDRINHYVEGLTSCYDDGAFCDTEQDITVYSYQISGGFLLYKITLKYDTFDLKDVENATGKDITRLMQDGKEIALQPGDTYVADMWRDTPEYRLNQTAYAAAAVTGRGVTTGDPLDKVVASYNLKKDYALWEVELDPDGDGVVTIESRTFTSGALDTGGVQNATLIFAYYKLEGQWIPLTAGEIGQYLAFKSGEDGELPYDGIIAFRFQFPFNGYSSKVADGTVASFSVYLEPWL